MEDSVRTEQQGHLLVITIDRPEVRNAMDGPTAAAMHAAMDRIDADPGIFAAILTGAGGNFSAGADLKAAARDGHSGAVTARGPFGFCMRPPAKPLIAAVEGVAVGGGFEMVLACDLIVAASDARFALPEVKRNLVALGGGLLRLPRRLPHCVAAEIALTGGMIGAEALQRWGLVNRLAAPGEALATARRLAADILANGPTALAATIAILRQAGGGTEEADWARARDQARPALTAADRTEGLRAFIEKRPPRWLGC
ncbi:crotonase/enoyl-CoA hydratase family protein [Niveispirillum sp. KHB5.9]|uniref:crotonase/enoyl-CoA hydratase family protein n=1 Tax=Niveispirillum sp. KHB5.9 TaxID=3400269 RepID=UPI003A859477